MESQRYTFRVQRLNDQHTTLMPGDVFKFNIKVFYHSINTVSIERPHLLHQSLSEFISCHSFFRTGLYFLLTALFHVEFFMENPEEILDRVVSNVREQFQFGADAAAPSPPPSPSPESEPRVIPLEVTIVLYDNHMYSMISASSDAIRRSLKKSRVTKRGECCAICLEDLVIDDECYSMPCNHAFHSKCIVTWLQTCRLCPLCRHPLPRPLIAVKTV